MTAPGLPSPWEKQRGRNETVSRCESLAWRWSVKGREAKEVAAWVVEK